MGGLPLLVLLAGALPGAGGPPAALTEQLSGALPGVLSGALPAVLSDALASRLDEPPDEVVTPGTIGFVVTFFVAVAVVLLVRDMSRRVRRLQIRAEERDTAMRREGGGGDGSGGGGEGGFGRGGSRGGVADGGNRADGDGGGGGTDDSGAGTAGAVG